MSDLRQSNYRYMAAGFSLSFGMWSSSLGMEIEEILLKAVPLSILLSV